MDGNNTVRPTFPDWVEQHDHSSYHPNISNGTVTGVQSLDGPQGSQVEPVGVFISCATQRMIDKIISCGVSPSLFVVGVVLNVINCVVFFRQGLKERMNMCLFCLSIADMLYIITYFLFAMDALISEVYSAEAGMIWDSFVRMYLKGLFRAFLYTSGCLTMIISVERCLCVVKPLSAANRMSTKSMGIIIAVTALFMQGICLVFPFELKPVTYQDPATNRTAWDAVPTQFYTENTLLFKIVGDIVAMGVVPLVTFTVVTIATIVTVVTLKRQIAWRHNFQAGDVSRSQAALVKMLVIVSCIYLVTSAPSVVLSVLRFVEPEFFPSGKYHNIFLATHQTYYALAMVNSSVNFFVYVTRSSKYVRHLRNLFPCSRE